MFSCSFPTWTDFVNLHASTYQFGSSCGLFITNHYHSCWTLTISHHPSLLSFLAAILSFSMHYLLATLIFWISKIAGAALEDTNSTLFRCGIQSPPAALLDMAMSMASSTSKLETVEANRALEINLYFHLVLSEGKEETVTGQMLEDQVRVLYYVHRKISSLSSQLGTTADPPLSSARCPQYELWHSRDYL